MLVIKDPSNKQLRSASFLVPPCTSERSRMRAENSKDVLLSIKGQERQVQQNSKPIAIDNKKEGQKGVDGGFGNDVCVQPVAEIDRVDIVTVFHHSQQGEMFFQIASTPYAMAVGATKFM
jgi:hypothetical protein